MLARLFPVLLLASTATAQGIPSERLFPLALHNRWQYEVTTSTAGPPYDRYYQDIEVVGDTAIGGGAWALLREKRLDSTYAVVASGHFAVRVVVDSVEVDLLACGWCGGGLAILLPGTLVANSVVIGGITYFPEGVGHTSRDGPPYPGGPGWVTETWLHATDIGRVSYVRDSESTGSPRTVRRHTLVFAVVGGVIYGQSPVASTPDPSESFPDLRVSPNPTPGQAALDFHLPVAADVRLEAFDAVGRRAALIHAGMLDAGAHVIPLDTSAWPPGVYVVRLVAGRWSLAARVVKR